ncbi:MAG: DJ-1/PfpI family protein [Acidobacteria bacterium]|nr:DJ-1/PfpI family protein [Acidobacteriota bacterium]
MKQQAYQLIFDGLADWETPYALCAITESQKLDVVTVGSSQQPITTMGGLKLIPDITLNDINSAEAGIFILPGGDMWERGADEKLQALLVRLHTENVNIAAICGATLAVARAGLTHNIRHTSNGKQYIKSMLPDYGDEAFYVDELAVTDQNIITASGLGGIEFGREVIKLLKLFSAAETEEWFAMHKHGVIPAKYQST